MAKVGRRSFLGGLLGLSFVGVASAMPALRVQSKKLKNLLFKGEVGAGAHYTSTNEWVPAADYINKAIGKRKETYIVGAFKDGEAE